MEIQSIYEVTELSKGSNEPFEEVANGAGQSVIGALRKKYHRFTKFVLRGFNINGKFVAIKLRHR